MVIDNQLCNLIDTGCVCNDTSEVAFLEAEKYLKDKSENLTIYEVSIGTGECVSSNQSQLWGIAHWLPNLPTIFMDLGNKNQEHELGLISNPNQRVRLNPSIPIELDYLDCPQYLTQYLTITQQWLNDNNLLLDQTATQLLMNKKLI